MLTDQLKKAYQRDGFLIVRQFLDPAEFSELASELDRYIRDVVPTLSEKQAFYDQKGRPETLKQLNHMSLDPYFRDYRQHAKWLALAEDLVGETVEPREPEWFNKPPGTNHPTPPHQDNYYFCMRPDHTVTLWLALDEVDDENGCLRYVAGSHLEPVRPHSRSNSLGFSQGISDYGADDASREVAIHLSPGDLVAHHGTTIHRADANRTTTRNRRAFAMVYAGVSCRRDEDAYARYLAGLKTQHETMGVGV